MKKRVKLEDDTKATSLAQSTKELKNEELSPDLCDEKVKVELKLERERVVLETQSKAAIGSTLGIVSVFLKKKENDEEKPITMKEENESGRTGDPVKEEHDLIKDEKAHDAVNLSAVKPEDDKVKDTVKLESVPAPIDVDATVHDSESGNVDVNEVGRFDSPGSDSKLSTRSTSTAAETRRTGSTIDDAIELSDDDDEDIIEVQRRTDVFCEVIELSDSEDEEEEDEKPIRRLPSTPLRSRVRAGPPEVIEIEDSDDEDNKPPIDYEAYMKAQEHPKFKVKKKEIDALPPDIAGPRLMAIAGPPFVPNPPPPPGMTDTLFPRAFTTNIYGGNTQDTCPKIKAEKLARHGLDDWMFLNLECNPHAPHFVGADGLCFGVGTGRAPERPGVFRVVSRIEPNKWMYCGQYRLEPSDSLSPREWGWPGKDKFRAKWIEMVVEKKWSRPLRTYVALRKRLGRAPSSAECNDASDALAADVKEKDIIKAFECGWLCITVRTMKCIDFEVDFLRDLVSKLDVWVPPPPKKKANSRSKKPVKAEPKEPSLGKRKRAAVKVKDEDDDEDEEADDSEAEAPPASKKQKKTPCTKASSPKKKAKRESSDDEEMDDAVGDLEAEEPFVKKKARSPQKKARRVYSDDEEMDSDGDFHMSTPQVTPVRKYALRARR